MRQRAASGTGIGQPGRCRMTFRRVWRSQSHSSRALEGRNEAAISIRRPTSRSEAVLSERLPLRWRASFMPSGYNDGWASVPRSSGSYMHHAVCGTLDCHSICFHFFPNNPASCCRINPPDRSGNQARRLRSRQVRFPMAPSRRQCGPGASSQTCQTRTIAEATPVHSRA